LADRREGVPDRRQTLAIELGVGVVEEVDGLAAGGLDDADAELDRERLGAVWEAFAPVRQLLATSSRPEVWETLPADRRWRLSAGRVTDS